MCSDGALLNPSHFPVASIEVTAAILFADLTGYSRAAAELTPAECAYLASQFFAWFEGEASRPNGGIIDKFIGDELMIVFPIDTCPTPPLESALRAAHAMLSNDPYAFEPKIGIACGPISVAVVGAESTASVTAMGQTVNLAARCVQTIGTPNAVRVATGDLKLVKIVFGDHGYWQVNQPTLPNLKNIGPTEVVDIRRLTTFVPMFDRFAGVRRAVDQAKKLGVVR
jgi:class 3 adenylate cyclase